MSFHAINRRTFLKTASTAAAVSLLPSRFLWAAGEHKIDKVGVQITGIHLDLVAPFAKWVGQQHDAALPGTTFDYFLCVDSSEAIPLNDAAINSSGLVPRPAAKRVRKEYCVSASTPLSVLNVPAPSRRVPFQITEALRSMIKNDPRFAGPPLLIRSARKSANTLLH